MELRDYLDVLWKRKWVVASVFVITVTTIGVGTHFMPRIYSASSLIRITQLQDSNVNWDDLQYSERLMNTYRHLLLSRPYLEKVTVKLELVSSHDALARAIDVEILQNTELIRITAENPDPTLAMEIANTLAQVLIQEKDDFYSGPGPSTVELLQEQIDLTRSILEEDRALLENGIAGQPERLDANTLQELNTKIRVEEQTLAVLLSEYEQARITEIGRANSISIIETATVPMKPSSPDMGLNLSFGAMIGLIGGSGLALVLNAIDPTISSVEEIAASTSYPLAGVIPKVRLPRGRRKGAFVIKQNGRPAAEEAFRAMRTNIFTVDAFGESKSILVTSPDARVGKSTVVANLSMALAESKKRVIAVDADLRNPWLHRVFDLAMKPGFTEVIGESFSADEALQRTEQTYLRVLSSGELPDDPTLAIGKPELAELYSKLLEEADFVLFDSPPLAAAVDAKILAPLVDLVLVVASNGHTSRSGLLNTIYQLERSGAKSIGVVLNKGERLQRAYYYSQ